MYQLFSIFIFILTYSSILCLSNFYHDKILIKWDNSIIFFLIFNFLKYLTTVLFIIKIPPIFKVLLEKSFK